MQTFIQCALINQNSCKSALLFLPNLNLVFFNLCIFNIFIIHTLGDISFVFNLGKKYTQCTFGHIFCLEPRVSVKIGMQYRVVTNNRSNSNNNRSNNHVLIDKLCGMISRGIPAKLLSQLVITVGYVLCKITIRDARQTSADLVLFIYPQGLIVEVLKVCRLSRNIKGPFIQYLRKNFPEINVSVQKIFAYVLNV